MTKYLLPIILSIFLLNNPVVFAEDSMPDDSEPIAETIELAASGTVSATASGETSSETSVDTNRVAAGKDVLNKVNERQKVASPARIPLAPRAEKKELPAKASKTAEAEPLMESSATYAIDKDALNVFVSIFPETVTPVSMSSSDVNRIHCDSHIKDVIYSKEKNIKVDYTDKDAFIKFLILRKDGKMIYATAPSELYVVCGNSVYTMLVIPSRIPAQTVRLIAPADRIKKNMTLFDGLPLEKKVINIIGFAYRDEIPDSFTVVQTGNRVFDLFADLNVKTTAEYRIDGESLALKVFRISLKPGVKAVELTEKDFLRAELTKKPVAIALDTHKLQAGGVSRLFVIEKAEEVQ